MTQTASSNIAQIEYWNTKAGETWAKFQEALDRQIETLGLAAMEPEAGKRRAYYRHRLRLRPDLTRSWEPGGSGGFSRRRRYFEAYA